MKKYVLTVLCAMALSTAALASNNLNTGATTASTLTKGYAYAHPEAEYSVTLPEAPSAVTIWAGEKKNPVPFLTIQPKYGAVGEVARFKRVDPDTGDAFEAVITFVKADAEFLTAMTREKMEKTLQDEFSRQALDDARLSYSSGSGTLKWATIAGFSVDESNNLSYNVAHFIIGMESVMLIKVVYNAENKAYQKYYDDLAKSIKYLG